MIWIIDYAQTLSNQICTVVAESVPHLQLGAIRDFQSIMKSQGYWDDFCWNETKHIYTFPNGSFIEFISFDKFGKAHGPRRHILYLNEANNIPWLIADQLITRTRKIVWLDWNPSEEFWYYTEMEGKRTDIDFLTLTYLDNEALDPISKGEIEAHKDNWQWWQVYGLGQLGVIQTRIYKSWKTDLEEIPHTAKMVMRWLDFGYTNDPTSVGAIYYHDGGYILDEELYQTGLSNKQIYDVVKNLPESNMLIMADSAEPKSIAELRLLGLNILGAEKGPDSIRNGIQLVQDQKITVTKRSINIIKEYRNYLWIQDKDGKILNRPRDIWNHAMDGIRYAFSGILKKPFISDYKPSAPAPQYYPDIGL